MEPIPFIHIDEEAIRPGFTHDTTGTFDGALRSFLDNMQHVNENLPQTVDQANGVIGQIVNRLNDSTSEEVLTIGELRGIGVQGIDPVFPDESWVRRRDIRWTVDTDTGDVDANTLTVNLRAEFQRPVEFFNFTVDLNSDVEFHSERPPLVEVKRPEPEKREPMPDWRFSWPS